MTFVTHKRSVPLHVASAVKDAADPALLLKGVQKYLKSDYYRTKTPSSVIWENGATTLLFYPASIPAQTNLFLVPSLINGAEIFDLLPEQSFIRMMNGQGINIYMLEWGNLGEVYNADFSLEQLKEQCFLPAVENAVKHAGLKLNILGYCLGGSLLCDFAASIPEQIASLTLLAAPVRFKTPDAPWAPFSTRKNQLQKIIESRGMLSRRMMQDYFAHLDHQRTCQKYARFLEMREDDIAAKVFVCVEDWLESGGDIPAQLAKDILQRYFNDDALMMQSAQHMMRMPVFVIASQRDRLVPYATAHPATGFSAASSEINPDCGHIGMMAGSSAQRSVWEPLCKFLLPSGA